MSWNTETPAQVSADILAARISTFLGRVYAWMFLGLAVTAGVALAVAYSAPLMEALIYNRLVLWLLFLGQLGLVIYLTARVEKMEASTAGALFLVYSATVGITTSVIILAFTGASLFSTFVVTAGMFGALAVYGTFTKRSLAGVGQFMFMGLIGLIIAMVVNIFVLSSVVDFVISVVGVIVFTGLTAWDAQRLKQMAVALPDGRTGSYAIVGALSLYLDFINLFFFLLRFMGGRRN
jgi:FtsH-binding integral membrane protein